MRTVENDPANTELPIGIFDSGVGGLTVVRELRRLLPNERFLYFGDTARVPYGSKSAETLCRFSRENTQFLVRKGIKQLIVACNSASAVAMDSLKRGFSVPMLGVVHPGAVAAIRATKSRRVGVIGTRATVESGAYARAIAAGDSSVRVFAQACPLFVPLAEENWTDGEVVEQIVQTYLQPLLQHDIDTLILGCTHYPLLHTTIAAVVGPDITLIDAAVETVAQVKQALQERGALRLGESPSRDASLNEGFPSGAGEAEAAPAACNGAYFVTDSADAFRRVGQRFLGESLSPLTQIDQSDLPWYERNES